MKEVDKALGSADSNSAPTSADEEDNAADGTPAASTTPAAAVAITTPITASSTSTTSPAAVASVDTALENSTKTENESNPSFVNAKLRESFVAELDLYTSGNQVDASPCYAAFESIFRTPGVRTRMRMLMNCIEGETRQLQGIVGLKSVSVARSITP